MLIISGNIFSHIFQHVQHPLVFGDKILARQWCIWKTREQTTMAKLVQGLMSWCPPMARWPGAGAHWCHRVTTGTWECSLGGEKNPGFLICEFGYWKI